MEKRYRWTRFTHIFKRGDVYALYNSLKLRPIYVSAALLEVIQSFRDGATVTEILTGTDPAFQEQFRTLLPALEEAKIIINAETTDDEILGFLQGHYLGHPYVSIAYFILTDACNFRCKYCFVENLIPDQYQRKLMNETTVTKGLDFFARVIRLKKGHFEEEKTIVIYGGEPMINKDALLFLLNSIREMKKNGRLPTKTEISMVTNGSLVTREVALALAEHRVNVAISLDGSQESTNSARCYKDGRPAFTDIIKGLQLLRECGVKVGISCTLNQASIDSFDETLRILTDQIKPEGLGFNILLSSCGYATSGDYDEKAAQALIKGFEFFRKRDVYEDRMMRKVNAFTKGSLYAFDCGAAGGGQIVIAPDGKVGICHGYLGNKKYFVTTVDDVDFDPSKSSEYMEWAQRSPLKMPECVDCTALGICGGGCPLNADTETGSIWGLDKRFCTHSKTALEWLIWDLYTHAKE
jgi:uncharacterized protein